jgi:hypothetical protein
MKERRDIRAIYHERESASLVQKVAKQGQAANELMACYRHWLDTNKKKLEQEPGFQRIDNQVDREVRRIHKEIHQGKTEHVTERFQQAVEQVVATPPRRALTYLQTLNVLQELLDCHREWYQVAPRSRPAQTRARRLIHECLQEIEAGHIEQWHERLVARLEALQQDAPETTN